MFSKLKTWLEGKTTHITVWAGVAIAGVSILTGGLDVNGTHIPPVDIKTFVGLLWGAIAASRLRAGVQRAEDAAKS